MYEAAQVESTLYMTFRVESELLALDVSQVREVLDFCPITRVPRAPVYMKGVVNLRGTVIPVIDLRLKFGMVQTESTIDSRIVVIEYSHDNIDTVETLVGILTDSVHDVIVIEEDQIGLPPETGARWRTEYIKGIGKHGDSFVLLLDIDRVMAQQEDACEKLQKA
jgi:purine-binding chemotaxis protein CheW